MTRPSISTLIVVEVTSLSPQQIGVIAAIAGDKGISYLNMGTFSALTAAQIAVLTAPQKASLSPAQHSSCGC